MQQFRDSLDFCVLKDLGFLGLPYTSSNWRFDGQMIWVRLDRAIASVDWMLKFPLVHVHHVASYSSNHKPIWLVSDDVHSQFYRLQYPFRFEAMWLKDSRCEGVVHFAWDMDSMVDPMGKVLSKVSNCQVELTSWNKKTFGNVCWSLAKMRKQLAEAESISLVEGSHERVKVLIEEINKLMDMEECM